MQITRIISTFLSLWKMPSQTNRQTTKQGYSWETILFYTLSDYVFSIMTRWYFHVISRFFGTMASQFKCPLLKASTDTQTWKRWCRIFQFTTKFLPETIDHFQTTTSNRNRRLRMKRENLWTCHWNLKTKVPLTYIQLKFKEDLSIFVNWIMGREAILQLTLRHSRLAACSKPK